MRISVQIVTKDRFNDLALLLLSLRNQTFKEWDLVLVDGSKPNPCFTYREVAETINRLRHEGHGVQIIVEKMPLGVCHARNKALYEDMFKNPLCCRIDDDSICEPDYLEKLYNLIKNKPKVAAVGGIVPLWGTGRMYRNIKFVKPIFNKIELDKEGNVVKMSDDGGLYYKPAILESHHIRSSMVFRRDMAIKVGGFPIDYGKSGFREETDFCLKLMMEGGKILTDTSAVCWHNPSPTGGVRAQDYGLQVHMANAHFNRKIKRWFEQGRLKL